MKPQKTLVDFANKYGLKIFPVVYSHKNSRVKGFDLCRVENDAKEIVFEIEPYDGYPNSCKVRWRVTHNGQMFYLRNIRSIKMIDFHHYIDTGMFLETNYKPLN